jgi:uncharacterized protein (DUF433 family)
MTTETDIGTLIARTPGLHGGRPHIAGSGVTVGRIVTWYKLGFMPEDIRDQMSHPTLSLAQVYAALAYYHAKRDEDEADLTEENAEALRLESIHRHRDS